MRDEARHIVLQCRLYRSALKMTIHTASTLGRHRLSDSARSEKGPKSNLHGSGIFLLLRLLILTIR